MLLSKFWPGWKYDLQLIRLSRGQYPQEQCGVQGLAQGPKTCTDLITATLKWEPPTFQVPVKQRNHQAVGCSSSSRWALRFSARKKGWHGSVWVLFLWFPLPGTSHLPFSPPNTPLAPLPKKTTDLINYQQQVELQKLGTREISVCQGEGPIKLPMTWL